MNLLPDSGLYSILILLFVLTFSAFLFSLGFTIFSYLHDKKNRSNPKLDPRDSAYSEAIRIVDQAREKAMGLLGEAHIEAKNILEGSEGIHTDTKNMVKDKIGQIAQSQLSAFDEMTSELLSAFKNALAQEKDASVRSITDISTGLKSELETEVHSLTASLKNVTQETENAIKTDIKGQYDLVTDELGNLASNLKVVTQQAQDTIKEKLVGEYDIVKNEVALLAENLKKITSETEVDLKQNIGTEYEEAKTVIHDFAEHLRQAAINTEENLKKDITQEFETVKKYLDDYKVQRMQAVDGAIRGVLEEVSRDVLGKTLNTSDHESLILKALDQIKNTTRFKEL